MKIFFTLIVTCCSLNILYAQTTYQKLFESGHGQGLSNPLVSKVSNGKFIITAQRYLSDNVTLLAVSLTDENGKVKWFKYFTDSTSAYTSLAYPIAVQSDKNHCIIIRGHSGNGELYMLKIDDKGNKVWSKSVKGFYIDYVKDAKATGDGHILVTGGGNGKAFLLKINGDDGSVVWMKLLESYTNTVNDGQEVGGAISVTKDSGFIAGIWSSNGYNSYDYDFLLAKYNKSGQLKWSKRIKPVAGNNLSYDFIFDIITTLDGGYAFTGSVRSSATTGVDDVYIIKTDSQGNVSWAKQFDNGIFEGGYSIIKSEDSSFTVGGSWDTTYYSVHNPFIMQISKNGDLEWYKQVSDAYPASSFIGSFNNIIKTKDKGFISSCDYYNNNELQSGILILKFDSSGNNCANIVDKSPALKQLPYTLPSYKIDTSDISNQLTVADIYFEPVSAGYHLTPVCEGTAKTKEAITGINNISERNVKELEVNILSNPVMNNNLNIEIRSSTAQVLQLEIYNTEGKNIHSEKIYNPGIYMNRSVNMASLPPGVYFIKLNGDKTQKQLSFIKQ